MLVPFLGSSSAAVAAGDSGVANTSAAADPVRQERPSAMINKSLRISRLGRKPEANYNTDGRQGKPAPSGRLFQVLDHGGQKAARFAPGHGAVIVGHRQRQDAGN